MAKIRYFFLLLKKCYIFTKYEVANELTLFIESPLNSIDAFIMALKLLTYP